MPYNAADPKAVRRAEKAARIAAREAGEVITTLMSSAPGRRWMWDFLAGCHIGAVPFGADDRITNFQCGEMNVGTKLLAQILTHCPSLWLQAMTEANERNLDDGRRDSDSDPDRSPASELDRGSGAGWDVEGPDPYPDGRVGDAY